MTLPASLLPQMVTIPSGVFNGRPIEAFQLSRNPVTNAEYAAHVDRFLSTPYVLLHTDPGTHETSILCRTRSPEEAIGDFVNSETEDSAISGISFGVFTLLKLSKEVQIFLGAQDSVRPLWPVCEVSWFHAFEYCAANGFYLPSDDQWSYAAGVHEGRKYATETETDAVFAVYADIEVNDPRVPDGYRGLRFMTGYLTEWTARNPSEQLPYGVRGGVGGDGYHPEDKKRFKTIDRGDSLDGVPRPAAYREGRSPDDSSNGHGFRVAAPLTR